MAKTILIATEKPFAEGAIRSIKGIIQKTDGFDLKLLENYTDPSELLEAVTDVHALIVRSDKVNDFIIGAANELKIIVRAGAGVDNVDLETASKRNIVVMNTPGQNANAVAELAFGLMLGLIRNKYNGTPGTELKGKSIGMHGYGNIGKCMSFIAKGFNMELFAFDPYIDQELITAYEVQPCQSVEELYEICNFISINIPVNEETEKLINYDLLSKTGSGSMLVNTARKEVVDEEGLLQIMEERPGFMYASDIAPSCKDLMIEEYPMRTLFTTKKMGAQTAEANLNAGVASINQIINYFTEGDTTFQVN